MILASLAVATLVASAPVRSTLVPALTSTVLDGRLSLQEALAADAANSNHPVVHHSVGWTIGGMFIGAAGGMVLGMYIGSRYNTNSYSRWGGGGAAIGAVLGGVTGYFAGTYTEVPPPPNSQGAQAGPQQRSSTGADVAKASLVTIGVIAGAVIGTFVVLLAIIVANGGIDLRAGDPNGAPWSSASRLSAAPRPLVPLGLALHF